MTAEPLAPRDRPASSPKVLLACVGGFLGAGKTSAIVAAASAFRVRGLSVGVVANDQGHDLVDTAVFRGNGLPAEEIAGGCFCCRFDELMEAAERLLRETPVDVLLAEAVGSCTDLVATVYRPLRRFFPDRFRLAPLSVLVEPDRLRELGPGSTGLSGDVAYIYDRQMTEADVLVLAKSDLLDPASRADMRRRLADAAPGLPVLEISSRTGEGVLAWVEWLAGQTARVAIDLDVDYDAYARGEAALGWLNASLALRRREGLGIRAAGDALIGEVGERTRRADVFLPHAKVLVASSRGAARVALTAARGRPSWTGDADLPLDPQLSAIVNVRAAMPPSALRRLVEDSVVAAGRRLGAETAIGRLECFSPSRPVPRYRLNGD